MTHDSYDQFLLEAQDLLQVIEQGLLQLKDNRTLAQVHDLMRSAHTLKGAAASVDAQIIKKLAHVLEDIFKALYSPDAIIDSEVETGLFQAYECLRLALTTEMNGGRINGSEILDRAAAIIAQLQTKLGDCFDREAPIPTSAELGFDIVQSMFEMGVAQRLDELHNSLTQPPSELQITVQSVAEVLLGLAESLELPGFAAIAQTTLLALNAHPDQVATIAQLALEDFRQGQMDVLNGDRTQGGAPSEALQVLANITVDWLNPPDRSGDFSALDDSTSSCDLELEHLFGQIDITPSPSADEICLEQVSNPVVNDSSSLTNLTPLPSSSSSAALDQTESMDGIFRDLATNAATIEQADVATIPPPDPPASSATPMRSPQPLSSPHAKRATVVRVEVEQLDRLNYLAGELLINHSQQTAQDEQLRLVVQRLLHEFHRHQQMIDELQEWSERSLALAGACDINLQPSPFTHTANGFDPLEMDRYTDLYLLLKSVVDQTSELEGITDEMVQVLRQTRQGRSQHQRLVTDMRDGLTATRMCLLDTLFQRFPPVVQQLTNTHAKSVDLVLQGTEVLVDKVLAETLYDPLLHLIRNAFDHGIEAPDVRRSRGKSETGCITLRSYQRGNRTVIEVSDDGEGIDPQRVAQQAIALNLVAPDQLQQMTEQQWIELLFEPGFSTASRISELSGRGVGLDVVRTQVERLKGTITVTSVAHQGTTFSLSMPTPLTITKLLLCQNHDRIYGFPIESIERIVAIPPNQLQRLVNYRLALHWQQGDSPVLVPIYPLSHFLSYASSNDIINPEIEDLPPLVSVLLIRAGNRLIGLIVDRVMGEQELVIRPLGTAIAAPSYIYGCCILGNNRLALAIETEQLLSTVVDPQESLPSLAGANGASMVLRSPTVSAMTQLPTLTKHSSAPKTLLVIDDSRTLRHMLTQTLHQAGYEVYQAQDGLEALDKLQHIPDIQLIICDVEMPRLNGFEFLNQSRRHPQWANIPIVMLTSRTGDKHRQFALQLGAAAYLTKPYVEDELLNTLNQLTPAP